MKFIIVSPGKVKEKFIEDKIDRFKKMTFTPFSIEFEWFNKKKNRFQEIIDAKKHTDLIVKCEEWGKEFSSNGFHEMLNQKRTMGISRVFFFIGDAEGYGAFGDITGDISFSLSQMTFPHDFARMMLAEQLYRVSTIEKGTDYNK